MDTLIFISGLVAIAGIYAMLSLILNLHAGILGLWDLGIAGFLLVGSYTYVLTTIDAPKGLGLPIWMGVILAVVVCVIFGLLIGLASLRLSAEYLLITTFAFAEVIRQIAANEAWLTNGAVGYFGLNRPLEAQFSGGNYNIFFAALVLVSLAVMYGIVNRLTLSPMGRLTRAVRENEPVTTSIGKQIFNTKLKIFLVSSALIGIVGAFYIWYSTIIVPGLFTSTLTFTVWTALVLGGIGNNKGAVLGSFVLILAQEFTRFIPVSAEMAVVLGGIRQFATGLLLVLVLRFLPKGIMREKFSSVEQRLKFLRPVKKS